MSLLPYLHRVAAGSDLSGEEAREAMSVLLQGDAGEAEIAGFLVALKMKGETAEELAGFARAMRDRMIVVDAGPDVIDTCGTGGDGSGTFNISTAVAIVMAGAGAHVAKHGNRSISSSSGSADVLEALGVRVTDVPPEETARSIREIGIGFLFAPALHPAMKHAQAVRKALKTRTVLNLLGPLVNPARAHHQLIGTPSPEAAKLMAEALAQLGTRRSLVVHGHDGLDEITTTTATDVYEVTAEGVSKHLWKPSDFGVHTARLDSLKGGDCYCNSQIILGILTSAQGPCRDIVLVNSAAGLLAAGLAADLREGMELASRSIDSGAALTKLELLRKNFPNT
ncbi:MAG TPA: anthranilate phosphoribosyltransferase [Bryobacteraceae bacterium]|jgi:anthranilate phosphoribosyltransferase|nr:anthranilate phosphoribosyltransferase [Bryobacteraceae bacterium]